MDEQNKSRFVLGTALLAFFIGYSGSYTGGGCLSTQFFAMAMWGYALLLDYSVYRLTGSSLAVSRTEELAALALGSLALVSFLEMLNLRLDVWSFSRSTQEMTSRWGGFAMSWSAVLPALFETAELLGALRFFEKAASPRFSLSGFLQAAVFALGVLMVFMAWRAPERFWPLAAFSFFLLAEPLNKRLGVGSLLREFSWGLPQKPLRIAAAGLVFGAVWSGLNAISGAKVIYVGLWRPGPEIMGLPLGLYALFPLLALQAYSLYSLSSAARGGKTWEAGVWAMRGKPPSQYWMWGWVLLVSVLFYVAMFVIDMKLKELA